MVIEQRFDRRHGKGAFLRLCAMLADPAVTYERIAKNLGLTKQRIGQLAKDFRIDGRQREHEHGKEASAFTKRMVEGKLVRLEFDPLVSRHKDKYSRTLAYVFLQDGTHLNAEIIRQGYGFAVSGSPPLKYQEEFRRLEGEAREQARGLWLSL